MPVSTNPAIRSRKLRCRVGDPPPIEREAGAAIGLKQHVYARSAGIGEYEPSMRPERTDTWRDELRERHRTARREERIVVDAHLRRRLALPRRRRKRVHPSGAGGLHDRLDEPNAREASRVEHVLRANFRRPEYGPAAREQAKPVLRDPDV